MPKSRKLHDPDDCDLTPNILVKKSFTTPTELIQQQTTDQKQLLRTGYIAVALELLYRYNYTLSEAFTKRPPLGFDFVLARARADATLKCPKCGRGWSASVDFTIDSHFKIEAKCKDCELRFVLDPDDSLDWDQLPWGYPPTDGDDQTVIKAEIDLVANIGCDFFRRYRVWAKKHGRKVTWFQVWVPEAICGTRGPGRNTLAMTMRILGHVTDRRWTVRQCLDWVEKSGRRFPVDIDWEYRGRPLPVLATVDAKALAQELKLSSESVWLYLRLLAHIGLIVEVARLAHGQKLYSVGWWMSTKDKDRPTPHWHLQPTSECKSTLRQIAEGQITLFKLASKQQGPLKSDPCDY